MTKVAISLPDSLAQTLDRVAAHQESSRSAIIARALEPFLDRAMVDLINSYVDEETDVDHQFIDDVISTSHDHFNRLLPQTAGRATELRSDS